MRSTVRSILTLGAACILGVAVGVLVNSAGLDREPVYELPVSTVESSPTPSAFAPEVNSTLERAVEDPQPTRARPTTRARAADRADGDNSGRGSHDSGRGGDSSGKGSGKGSEADDDSGGGDD